MNKFAPSARKKFWLILVVLFCLTPKTVFAQDTSCDNRYLTLVNPVRSRELWSDKSLRPFNDQLSVVNTHKFNATWLLQYDVLEDMDLSGRLKQTDKTQEKGLLLEVSEKLSNRSRVIYPYNKPWFDPSAVFLSGYSQSERKRLIDTSFSKFKDTFGFYPKSVGAWWIDSYSLNYMNEKYGIKTTMIVADQKTTDNYGVWGQWWGVPYYPSKANILAPASSLENKQDVVMIQWAQRDPSLALGNGFESSNFSLQANDYTREGKDTEYFKKLSRIYLDCQNKLGQITVGLETGIEGVNFQGEYMKQLDYLEQINNLQSVTMSEFGDEFKRVYPGLISSLKINDQKTIWNLTAKSREGGDNISYNQQIAFKDYFLADKSDFLDRNLKDLNKSDGSLGQSWIIIGMILLILILGIYRNLLRIILTALVFYVTAYGLLLRSDSMYGWQVFYGPAVGNALFVEIILLIFTTLLFYLIKTKIAGKYLIIFAFIFGLDYLLSLIRFTLLSGKYYLGFGFDSLSFAGIGISKNLSVSLINTDLPGYQAAALLRFNFSRFLDNPFLSLVVWPLAHIIVAFLLIKILQNLSSKARVILVSLLVVFWLFYLGSIFQVDPRIVM